ncbi:hypothetical protein D3218_05790 [Aureimonas flava]|uniref:Glycosyltransferase RgtA/B/C/D-like domain-containing protein n=1 Tax=Aureimonas flava TaxID=2320271 RepID=A0A3A1WUR2_9HYPH|nr:hypothetical protein [Aureimonas flava]RIY01840.1 hypothetical protein D3218_05790 [Aureimonas flava]
MTLPIETRVDPAHPSGVRPATAVLSPVVIGLAVTAVCALLLSLPLSLPIGPMYWDVVVFVDGGWRVLTGQTPSVDFFAPVGPLGYWLFAAGLELFPRAQPVLLAQWMLLPVSLAGLLPVLARIDRRSRRLALALLVPFLVFQLLPTNFEQFSSYPSVDGFGIYNRHATQLLYVLTVALVFERRQRMLLFVIAWTCLALFLSKITGFLSAGILCAFAFAAGRVRLGTALGALLGFGLVLAGLEATLGVVSAYIRDIAALVGMNEGVLASRFVQAASIHFGIFAAGSLLVAALLLADRGPIATDALALVRQPLRPARWSALLDRDVAWLGVALLAGLSFETQNTGGQAFIFVWPVLVRILCDASRHSSRMTATVLVLAAAVAMPPLVNVLHRTARALVGQALYVKVPAENLRALDSVTQRPELVDRAERMIENYVAFPQTYEALAEQGQLPIFSLYSELDFQAAWLIAANEAVEAIRAFETANGVRFETIMSLNFVNPFPYALERKGTPRIAIGADPFRAVPPPDARTIEAVRRTDLVLLPLCPITMANQKIQSIYAEGLSDRVAMPLSRCWTAYVRPGLLRGN